MLGTARASLLAVPSGGQVCAHGKRFGRPPRQVRRGNTLMTECLPLHFDEYKTESNVGMTFIIMKLYPLGVILSPTREPAPHSGSPVPVLVSSTNIGTFRVSSTNIGQGLPHQYWYYRPPCLPLLVCAHGKRRGPPPRRVRRGNTFQAFIFEYEYTW